jgi:AraC-like DNA-binding protein
MHYVQRSSLCIVAQGAKIAMIGGDTYDYEAGQMAVYSIDVPMAGRVTRASYSEPYLLLMIDLDAEKIAELALKVFPHGLPRPRDTLRLQEARRLMLTAMLDAGQAGRRVGYSSASQFTREYGRFFGNAPKKDINRLREQGLNAADA